MKVRRSPTHPSPILSMGEGEGGGAFLVKRISYLACDDADTLILSCASRFTNDASLGLVIEDGTESGEGDGLDAVAVASHHRRRHG